MAYYYTLSERIKESFATVLKRAFKTNFEYTYADELLDTKITILEAWNTNTVSYPVISVEASVTDLYRKTFDDYKEPGFMDVSYNGITYTQVESLTVGGTFDSTVEIVVGANNSVERDRIADWTALYLRHIFSDELIKRGVTIQDIKRGGNTQVQVGNDMVHFATIVCVVITDWEEQVVVNSLETLSGLCNIQIVEQMLDGSTILNL